MNRLFGAKVNMKQVLGTTLLLNTAIHCVSALCTQHTTKYTIFYMKNVCLSYSNTQLNIRREQII